eukprot:TRINITY_DN10865_c0_g1_i2.p1 TRINITY_DN10865_c0_g1~~TRINITY_DN10865_c0_g1_i2.p1  ORF type:complete len:509 (+),score=121.70 TRINITY_DN10865_c0_g1_i2:44-1570(+)
MCIRDRSTGVVVEQGVKMQLGIQVKKEEDFSKWYTEVIQKAEMIDYGAIAGCYILRPWSYSIWEQIQKFVDAEIKKLGVQNAYFPLFVTKSQLTAEEDHFDGFEAEVAWVTKAGKSELAEHIAVRPTSETIMYPLYAKWIRSHRDLPLRLNQWNNVVRWEFKQTVPFLRSREFLWQEGHTAFATKSEADEEVLQILEIYRRTFEELLAIPVVKGKKSEKEKFAGGDYTTTCEAFIPTNGRAIQGATSHGLGQHFSKLFNINFEDEKEEKAFAWQNSWGITTRTIGCMTMIHGDDKGLVLPPRVAPIQAVLVPIYFKNKENAELTKKGQEIVDQLNAAGFRTHFDDRRLYKPGWKYNFWEMKGVPVRIELGPRDMKKNEVVLARRDWKESDGKAARKVAVSVDDLTTELQKLLDSIHDKLFQTAKQQFDEHTVKVTKWDDFVPTLDGKNVVLAPWCDTVECEKDIKGKSAATEVVEKKEEEAEGEATGFGLKGSAKSLCKPFDLSLIHI